VFFVSYHQSINQLASLKYPDTVSVLSYDYHNMGAYSNKTVISNDSLVIKNYGNDECMFQVIHNCRLIKDLNRNIDDFQFE